MDALPFIMPAFTRLNWVSESVRQSWEGKLDSVVKALRRIEWLTAASELRKCVVVTCSAEEYVAQAHEWMEKGLFSFPFHIEQNGQRDRNFFEQASSSANLRSPLLHVVVGKAHYIARFREALLADDHQDVGEMLGHPKCCQEAARRIWVEKGGIGSITWYAALNTLDAKPKNTTIEIQGSCYSNFLWRCLGIHTVSHFPCKFDCAATIDITKMSFKIGREFGYKEEIDLLEEVLRWPVEWSALHGIAEIKTPVLRVTTATDATAKKYVVQLRGERYPIEGASALSFPYRVPERLKVTDSHAFHTGMINPIIPLSAT